MAKSLVGWFNKQSRIVQIILLLVPFVNWVTEIVIRWSAALRSKKLLTILFAVLVTFFGLAIGWLDVVWCLLFKHMIFTK